MQKRANMTFLKVTRTGFRVSLMAVNRHSQDCFGVETGRVLIPIFITSLIQILPMSVSSSILPFTHKYTPIPISDYPVTIFFAKQELPFIFIAICFYQYSRAVHGSFFPITAVPHSIDRLVNTITISSIVFELTIEETSVNKLKNAVPLSHTINPHPFKRTAIFILVFSNTFTTMTRTKS